MGDTLPIWNDGVILFTWIAGWLMGWINEKESDGSIVTSWLLYFFVNYLASN